MRLLLPFVLVLASCKKPVPADPIAAETPEPAVSEASAALAAFFERTHTERVDANPVLAAYLGEPHDPTQWTPFGEAFETMEKERSERWLTELDALSTDGLTEQEALSIRLFREQQERDIASFDWRMHDYPLTHISGLHVQIASFLMTVHRIESEEDAVSWSARVRNAPALLDQVLARVQAQAEMGIRPPAYCYPQMQEAIGNLLTGAPFTDGDPSPLLAHFEGALAELDVDEERKTALRAEAVEALKTLAPAYTRITDHLEADAPNAVENGAWALPDGPAYYAWRLEGATTTKLSPAEIHQLGLDEVARIHDEMRALMPALGVEGDIAELFAHLREDPRYTQSDDAAGREAYLDAARGYVAGFEAVLPDVFEHQPEAPLIVKRVEEWREKSAGKAFYQSPSKDGSRPGIFYANLARMEDMPTYQLEALVYHEGIPGHHMQNAVSQRLDDLPPFRRFGHYTAYGEGWGLYSEYLPKELGFYEDPASDVGRLAMELWRAARLVVDTGLHDKKWTREEAIEYLVTQTPNPRGDAVKAIDRYMVWPGQATAYKVGMLEILRMREAARDALGDDFDLRGFHGVVLGTGPVPLGVLDAQVQGWVARQRSSELTAE